MTTIGFNVPGSPHGGGPSVFVWKTTNALRKRGYNVVTSNLAQANGCICIIESGKVLRQVDRNKTKILVRIDGIYNHEYNVKFNRAIRPDMTALHNKLKADIPAVDHVIYQSSWSKERIDEEIVSRQDGSWSIINNGIDTGAFKPISGHNDGKGIKLMHVGKMRDDYLMRSLIGTYSELKKRGMPVKLIMVGSMDGACKGVLAPHRGDPNIQHIGNVANNQLPKFYSMGDVYLGPRQGSSCDNVIAEAQACGLPVVIPTWGGNKDMVVDGKTGVVVESGHWDYDEQYVSNMANAVEHIVADLSNFKKQAREHATANLTIDEMVDKYLEALGL